MAVGLETSERQLATMLPELVTRGIITEQQAQQIADLHAPTPRSPPARDAGWLRPLVAEALGYVGGALATLATLILIQQFWGDLQAWSRVTLLGATAAGLMIAGALARSREGPADRLRGFLWLLSAVAVGGAVAVGLFEYTGLRGPEMMLATGLLVTVYALGVWRLRNASLQQLTAFAAVLVTVTAGLGVADPAWVDATGLAVWTTGVAWATAAWAGWIHPRRTGLLIGAATALLGPITVPDDRYGWVLAVGLATAGVLVALSIPIHETVLLGLGVVGIFAYVPRIVFQYFGDTLGAPVSLLVTGAVLVAVALTVARARPAGRHGPDDGDDQNGLSVMGRGQPHA